MKIDQKIIGDDQIIIAVGETRRTLQFTLTKEDGSPESIAGWTIEFHMGKYGASELKVKAAVTPVDEANGVCKYQFVEDDVKVAGTYRARLYIDDTSDTGYSGYFIIRIEDPMPRTKS